MLENKFTKYIYSGVNVMVINKPIWQEIGKDNKPIESYMISTIDNSPKIINKPDILKVKDTPEYWGAYYNVSNKFLKNPTAIPEFMNSYLPGIPDLTWAGVAGYTTDKLIHYDNTFKDIKDNINAIEDTLNNIKEKINKDK